MGIGKQAFRAFIEGFKLTREKITGKSVVIDGNWYINRKIGLAFEKPPGWHFVHTKDYGSLKEGQIIGTDLEETDEEIWHEMGEPACLLTKYDQQDPALKGVFSPTIMLHLGSRMVYDEANVDSFREFLELTRTGTAAILKDFQFLHWLPTQEISGCEIHEADSTYLFEHQEIEKPLPVELKSIHFLNKKHLFSINLHQSAAQGQLATEEFDQFLKSMRII